MESSVESKEKQNKVILLLAFLSAIVITFKLSLLTGAVAGLYYAWIFFIALYNLVVSTKNHTKVSLLGLAFLLIGALSITFNALDMAFQPYLRYSLFVALFVGFGPLLSSQKSYEFRQSVIKYMQWGFVILTIGSFIAFVLDLPIATTRTGFRGITPHSMDLSPISALTALFGIDKLANSENKKGGYLGVGLLAIGLTTMIIAASRGAIIAFIASASIYALFKSTNISKTICYIALLISVIGAIIMYNPLDVMDGLNTKMERSEMDEDITGGRLGKFDARFMEFKENPILGCGFSTMRYTPVNPGGHFEPGSGWIFILSSMGLSGLIIALLLNTRALTNCWKRSQLTLCAATTAFFMCHTLIEGYTLTVGNAFCLYMWMNIGVLIEKRFID